MSHALNDDPAVTCASGAEAAEHGRWEWVAFAAPRHPTQSRPCSVSFLADFMAMLGSRAGGAASAVLERAVMMVGAAYVTIVFSIADYFAKSACDYDAD